MEHAAPAIAGEAGPLIERRRERRRDPTRGARGLLRYLPRRRRAVRILLVRGDPYLALLLRMQLPGSEVVEAHDDDAAREQVSRVGLVIAPVRPGSTLLEELLAMPGRPPVVGLVDTDGARTLPPSGVDQILLRPFVPGELNQAVRRALDLPEPLPPRPMLPLVRRIVAGARLGAVAFAAVLMVNERLPSWRALVLTVAFLYATVRIPNWRWPRIAGYADAVVAGVIVALTAAQNSEFVVFAIVAAIGIAIDMGPKEGLAGGGVVSLISFPATALALVHKELGVTDALVFVLLFPLVGLAAGYARQTLAGVDPDGATLFAEANRMLSALYRFTREMPGGLEVSTVGRTALQVMAESMNADAAAVLVEEGGVLLPVAAFGIDRVEEISVRPNEGQIGETVERGRIAILDTSSMAPNNAIALGHHSRWYAAPIRRAGAVLGVLLAANPKGSEPQVRTQFQRLAAEAAVAIENARLFARVRGLTIDEERRRFAREIHDGVAQALTHVRLELDYLARTSGENGETKEELQRLARVVKRAGDDVRTMIVGLRSGISIGRRIVPALEAYLNDLQGLGGPKIELEASSDPLLAEEVAAECFRIVQEAVSNARRHSEATTITVRVDSTPDVVTLRVSDDGVGITDANGGGFGIEGMKERARLIGATLDVTSKPGAGAVVRLDVPKEVEA
jgi:signal transduction histidine kinase